MVEVEIRVLKGVSHIGNGLLDVLSLLELSISKHHLAFVVVNVSRQIEFFVFVKHVQELLVVLVALALVRHVGGYIFDHALKDGDHLLGEMLEFFALVVKLVSCDRVIKVDLNVQDVFVLVHDFSCGLLWNHIKHFAYVSTWPRENSEFLGVQDKVILGQFFQESFQVEPSFIDEFDVLVVELLGWQHRKWDPRPSLLELFEKVKKLIVSPLSFPEPLFIRSLTFVYNVA